MTTKDRLERGVRVLTVLDERRTETGNASLGAGIERFIVSREMRDLEEEILADPGALEAFLVKRK